MALLNYLADRRAQIETQLKALKAELGEIRIAEAALAGAPVGRTALISADGVSAAVRSGSIKDWVLKALTDSSDGLETDSVIDAVLSLGGPAVPRSSMTPQLSRLKAAGLIIQDGRNWRLPPRSIPKNEALSGDQPPSASVSEGIDDPFG